MEFGLYPAPENKDKSIKAFYGINRTRSTVSGDAQDMQNMSSDEFPCLSVRKKRTAIAAADNIRLCLAPDSTNTADITGFTGIAGEAFYYNGEIKSGDLRLPESFLWQVERMGNLYIINGSYGGVSALYYYNVDNDNFERGGVFMDNLIVTSYGSTLATYPHRWDGMSKKVPLPDGTTFDNDKFWSQYGINGVRLSDEENIFEKFFKIGDEITISGFPKTKAESVGQVWHYDFSDDKFTPQTSTYCPCNNTLDTDAVLDLNSVDEYKVCKAVVSGFHIISGTKQEDGTNYHTYIHQIVFDLYNKNGDKVEFDNLGKGSGESDNYYCSGVMLSIRQRTFDNIAIHHGRIWGSSPTGNTLFASSSDDIFSFTSEDISAMYAARLTSDTPGKFTALASYGGELLAFKEDSISIVSGTNPKNYYVSTIMGIGCTAGRSVCVTPKGIIFLSRGGFYIWSGALPECISHKLNTRYTDATSGFDGKKYYASALREDGVYELVVFDTEKGLWHIEDNIEATGIFRHRDGLYIADKENLYRYDKDSSDCQWQFTLMRTNNGTLNKKGINEIYIYADISEGASFWIETRTGNNEFKRHTKFSKTGLNVYRSPVRLKKDESFTVRIAGSGRVIIHEVLIEYSEGGKQIMKEE